MRNTIRLTTLLLVLAVSTGACLPATPTQAPNTPVDIQAQVNTAVAQTIAAQNQIGTSVAQTLEAQITLTPTLTETPIPTITPLVLQTSTHLPSGGGGGGGTLHKADYACSWREVYPRFNNNIRPGESFDVVWVITNTGAKAWPAGKDLDYVNGTVLSPFLGHELPAMKSGDSVTISFVATAPMDRGLYGMQFKVEGGLCWPALNIEVGKKDP